MAKEPALIARSRIAGERNRKAVQAVIDRGITETARIARIVGISERSALRHKKAILGLGALKRPRPDEAVLEKAREMLEDRAGYAETARTLGVDKHALTGYLPGYALTPKEVNERRQMGRVMKSLERGSHAEQLKYV